MNVSLATDERPIGLFDSGIGGLTVLRSLLGSLPHESFVYLGDTARLPYGSKSPQTIERYVQQNIRFLKRLDVKAIVVACNSASTALIGRSQDFGLPVYNVIEPGAETALARSKLKRIGVLGTKATVAAEAYPKALRSLDARVQVTQQACPLFVPLVEEGWTDDPVTEEIVRRYLAPVLSGGSIDTLILGCTHYPALVDVIGRIAGPGVQLVDSASAVHLRIESDMEAGTLLASAERRFPLEVMTTDVSPGFLEVARRLIDPHEVLALREVDIG